MSRTTKNYSSQSHLKGVAVLLLALLAIAPLSGCGPEKGAETETLRVGLALYIQDDTFISTIVQDLERIAQEEELARDIKINLSVADGRSNQTTQLEQVDRLITWGCDVLCVNIVDRTAAAVLIDKAEEAGVPLIFFNRQPVAEDMERWDQLYYVGARAEEGGILQGQLVLKAWLSDRERLDKNGDGILQYVMLEGEPGHQDALLRTEYSIQVLSEAGVELEKLGSDTGNWKRGPAATKMGQWLEEFGDQIEAVIANNDDMALGAIDAYGQTDWELPLVVGVDATAPALQAVAEGTLYGTVLNDAEGIARAMLDLTLALSGVKDSGDTVELTGDHYVWLSYQKVTKENLADFQME